MFSPCLWRRMVSLRFWFSSLGASRQDLTAQEVNGLGCLIGWEKLARVPGWRRQRLHESRSLRISSFHFTLTTTVAQRSRTARGHACLGWREKAAEDKGRRSSSQLGAPSHTKVRDLRTLVTKFISSWKITLGLHLTWLSVVHFMACDVITPPGAFEVAPRWRKRGICFDPHVGAVELPDPKSDINNWDFVHSAKIM